MSSFLRILLPWFNKICSLIISSHTALGVPNSRRLFSKNTTGKFMQIVCNVIWRVLVWKRPSHGKLKCCFREGVYHNSTWFSRKRLFALQSYNSWQGLKIATRQTWLHNSLRSPRPINEFRTISASIHLIHTWRTCGWALSRVHQNEAKEAS